MGPRVVVSNREPEIVPQRDVAAKHHGAIGVADVERIGKREQRLGRDDVDDLGQRGRNGGSLRGVLGFVDPGEIPDCAIDDLARVFRRANRGRQTARFGGFHPAVQLRLERLQRSDRLVDAVERGMLGEFPDNRLDSRRKLDGVATLLLARSVEAPHLRRCRIELVLLPFPGDDDIGVDAFSGQRGEQRIFEIAGWNEVRTNSGLQPSHDGATVSAVLVEIAAD